MIVYHGTTDRRAQRICLEGFLPRKPSRRVWFAKSKAYAEGRARAQARRSHDRAVVLTCNVDFGQLRARLGGKRVFCRGGNFAVDGPIPATVVRSHPGQEVPTSPAELAKWINSLLGLKPHKGVTKRHWGIERLSRWITNRLSSHPATKLAPSEVLRLARQWLPEFFEGAEIDPERLKVHRRPRMKTIELKVEAESLPQVDQREEEALELLQDARPSRRARGLAILAELDDPDLFDWCAMYLDDDSTDVRLAALHLMLRCREGDPETAASLADSQDRRIRAVAIAVLARHSGQEAPRWFERGLKDPSPCVRLTTAALLGQLDPGEHRVIFELALYDPNPQVVRLARKLTAGKGYPRSAWPRPEGTARRPSRTN